MHPDTPFRTARARAKAERRQALIDATIDTIAARGLSGTTMARVAKSAGASVGLVNFHFASKEALFAAVLTHLAEDERDIWQRRMRDSSLSAQERLIAMVDARFHPRCCDRRRLAVWFAFWGDATARTIYRQVVADLDDERLDATRQIIEELVPQGPAPGCDARQTALGLEAFYDGLQLNFLLYPEEFTRQVCRQRALEHLQALFPRLVESQPLAPSPRVAAPARKAVTDAP